MEHARRHHRDGIERHFSQHLTETDIKALTRALEKISTHARPLRPGTHPRLTPRPNRRISRQCYGLHLLDAPQQRAGSGVSDFLHSL